MAKENQTPTPPPGNDPAAPSAPPPAAPAQPEPTTDRIVITNETLGPGAVSINGDRYTFTKGQAKRVPAEVRDVLKNAGYLLSDEPAR